MSDVDSLDRPYREQHESFVSNLKGTSPLDVLVSLAHFPIALILLKLLQKGSTPMFLRDVTGLMLPLLLCLTLFADYSYLTLLVILIGELWLLQRRAPSASVEVSSLCGEASPAKEKLLIVSTPRKLLSTSFITLFKGKLIPHVSLVVTDACRREHAHHLHRHFGG